MVSVSTREIGKAQQEGPEELDRALEQIDAEEADWSRLLDRACEVERELSGLEELYAIVALKKQATR